ncbi:MAG: amidohydrolase [Rhodospirillaceae bacterium]|nr:amidohydrolase [Rhodospirillaceae bacterium]
MNTKISAGSPTYVPVRDRWLERYSEEILQPELPIIDPHHHIWDRAGWRYMIDELEADLSSGHNIVSTVFVQCHAMYRADGPPEMAPVGETEFVNGVAAVGASGLYGDRRMCSAIVGHADLRLGKRVEDVLDAHVTAGGGRFRGIRHISAWDADESLMNPSYHVPKNLFSDPGFREGFGVLTEMGMSFDAWLFHPQIPELTDLARAFPDASLILDHCGGPVATGSYSGRKDEEFRKWTASIKDLSTCPNVTVKVGGLGMRISGYDFHEHHLPPSSDRLAEAWKPYVETCIDTFGPDRCMFESNFPVDKGSYAYPIFWNACKKLALGASNEEKTSLFSGTAERVYRI